MIDGTEKPQIPSKFANRAARYNEFGYNLHVRHALSRGCFCTTTAWNVSRFMGEVNSRPQFSFFFFQFKTSPLEFVSRKIDIISKCWTSLNKGMNKVFYANLMKVTNIKFHVMYSDPKFDKKKKCYLYFIVIFTDL